MIAVLKNGTTEKQLDSLINWIESLGLTVHLSRGDYQTIVGLVGDTSKVDADLLGSEKVFYAVIDKNAFRGCFSDRLER